MDDDATPPTPPTPRAAARPAEERAAKVRRAVYDFLSRREAGEDLAPEAFQADHAGLMPDLAEAIAAALRNYRRVFDARRAWDGPDGAVPPGPTNVGPAVSIRGYRIRREISSGGQGTVFEAVHEPTGRVVAVKVMSGVSKNSVARFEREARALATLSHPGLVGILDRGLTAAGAYYLSVEYVAGQDLDDWVRTCRRDGKGARDVVGVLAKAARALEAAHARGIVHRDVKPSNVRVDALDNPRVIDFGLAHVVEAEGDAGADRRLTVTRDVVGSLHWLSPEQASGDVRAISPASDVYALGVVLYHALTGRFPYPTEGPIHEVTRHICDTPPAHATSAPAAPFGPVDPLLAGVLDKCLRKRPADRYATAGAVAADLEAYLAGTLAPVNVRPAPPRRWVVAAAAGITLIAIAAWFGHRSSGRSTGDVAPPVALAGFTNPVGMEFVDLPLGRFGMGSPSDEPGRRDDEQPHPVRLTRPISMGRTEVTRAQYLRVTGSLPAGVDAEPGNLPVERVRREEVDAFCAKLREMDGRTYRLPTEAEWEYACRAGTATPFAVRTDALGDAAWYAANSAGAPHPVAAKRPNRWGLYDMHGNVAELTSDQYIPHLGEAERVDPTYVGGNRIYVVRGGSASDPGTDCRSASRGRMRDGRQQHVGFRVVVDRG